MRQILELGMVGQKSQTSGTKRLPGWLKRSLPLGNEGFFTENLINDYRLVTVCESARCPNRPECYSRRTATFMILGNHCTRPCGFCSVPKGEPDPVENDEPLRLAEAALKLGLKHVVITSVTRDDLPDGGANHFRLCIEAVRAKTGAAVEVLTPDFLGDLAAVEVVMKAAPDVFNHNMETVPRLYRRARGRADYLRSLQVLRHAKDCRPDSLTKSGLMAGLGETNEELLEVFADLRAARCDMLTIGQYLAPTPNNIPVARFVPPAEFEELKKLAEKMGFAHVAAGPFVRSSYHAGDTVDELLEKSKVGSHALKASESSRTN
jgi:lipoic acid synthetase